MNSSVHGGKGLKLGLINPTLHVSASQRGYPITGVLLFKHPSFGESSDAIAGMGFMDRDVLRYWGGRAKERAINMSTVEIKQRFIRFMEPRRSREFVTIGAGHVCEIEGGDNTNVPPTILRIRRIDLLPAG